MTGYLKNKIIINLTVFIAVCLSSLWLLSLLNRTFLKSRQCTLLSLRGHRYIFFSTPQVYSKEFKSH